MARIPTHTSKLSLSTFNLRVTLALSSTASFPPQEAREGISAHLTKKSPGYS